MMLKDRFFSVSPRPLRHLLAVVALAAGLSSCALFGRGSSDAPEDPYVSVEVANQNLYEATVYVMRDGSRVRVGTVPGNSTHTLSAPFPVSGRMSVEVRLTATGSYASWPVNVARGQTVRVEIPANLHLQRGRFPR
jgi:hypothetical protein